MPVANSTAVCRLPVSVRPCVDRSMKIYNAVSTVDPVNYGKFKIDYERQDGQSCMQESSISPPRTAS